MEGRSAHLAVLVGGRIEEGADGAVHLRLLHELLVVPLPLPLLLHRLLLRLLDLDGFRLLLGQGAAV